MVVVSECGAECAAGVTGGGLDPDVAERAFAKEAGVGDAVEGNAAGEAEIFFAGHRVECSCEAENNFLGHILNRAGEVAVDLF